MAEYAVVGDTLLLTSTDFGDGSVELRLAAGGRGHAPAAEQDGGGEHFMRDDEVNAPETPDA